MTPAAHEGPPELDQWQVELNKAVEGYMQHKMQLLLARQAESWQQLQSRLHEALAAIGQHRTLTHDECAAGWHEERPNNGGGIKKSHEEEHVEDEMNSWRGRQAHWWTTVSKMGLYKWPHKLKEYNRIYYAYIKWDQARREREARQKMQNVECANSDGCSLETNETQQQSRSLFRFEGTLGGIRLRVQVASGASENFISRDFCKKNGIYWRETGRTQAPHMAGVSPQREAEQEVNTYELQINDFKCQPTFKVTKIGQHDAILGMPWLRQFKPEVDWTTNTLQIKSGTRSWTLNRVRDMNKNAQKTDPTRSTEKCLTQTLKKEEEVHEAKVHNASKETSTGTIQVSRVQKIPRQEFPETTDDQTRLEPPPEERSRDSNKFRHDGELVQWQKAFCKAGRLQASYHWKEYTRHREAFCVQLGIRDAGCEAGPAFMMTSALKKGTVQWRAVARSMANSLLLALRWYEPERGKTSTDHVSSGCKTIHRSAMGTNYQTCQERRHELKNVPSSAADFYYDEAGRNNDMLMAIAEHQGWKTPTRSREMYKPRATNINKMSEGVPRWCHEDVINPKDDRYAGATKCDAQENNWKMLHKDMGPIQEYTTVQGIMEGSAYVAMTYTWKRQAGSTAILHGVTELRAALMRLHQGRYQERIAWTSRRATKLISIRQRSTVFVHAFVIRRQPTSWIKKSVVGRGDQCHQLPEPAKMTPLPNHEEIQGQDRAA